MRIPTRSRALLIAVATVAIPGVYAPGASITWDGGPSAAGTDWNTPANWSGDVLPGAADTVVWTNAGLPAGTTISLGASQTIREFRINSFSNVNAFTIGSAADNAAGYTLTLTNVFRGDNNGNTQTIASKVNLAGDSQWNIINGYNGAVAVTGAIGSAADVVVSKEGTNTLTFNGANTFTGSVRVSNGTLSLGGTNAYTGNTDVSGGALTLNFNAGAGATPASDIVNSGSKLVLGGTRGSGSLTVNGRNLANATNSQSFNGLAVNGGASLSIVNGVSSGKTLVSLGAITRTAGGNVNFVQPTVNTTISAQNGFTTTNTNDPSGILGGYATVGGADWATNNGTNIVAYTGYTTLAGDNPSIADGPNTNVRINNSSALDVGQAAGTTTVNTLLVNDGANRTVTVGAGNTLRLGTVGGILKTGAGVATIGAAGNAGTLTAGGADNAAGEIVVTNSTPLVVNSVVADNGTGAVTLTKAGSSTLTLNDVSTNSGGTYVNAGVLAFAGSNATTYSAAAANATSITVASTAGLAVGQTITGSNLKTGTRITGITGTTVNLSTAATNSGAVNNVAVTAYTGATGNRLSTTGDIVVAGGTLEFGNSSAVQSTSGAVVIQSGVMNNGTLTKSGANYDARGGTVSTVLAGSVGLTKTTFGTLTFANASPNTYTGDTTILEGSIVGGANNGAIAIPGNLIVGSASGGNAASYSNGSGNVAFASSKNVTVYSNGTVNFGSGAQSLSGTININGGSVSGSQIYNQNATWNLTGGTVTGNFYVNGGTYNILSSPNTSVVGVGTSAGNQTFNVADGAAATDVLFSGNMGGAFNLTKNSAGKMVATGNSSYTGVTTLNAGTLSISSLGDGLVNSNIGAASNLATRIVLNGGTLQYTGGATSTDRSFTVGTTSGVSLDASGTGPINFRNTGAYTLSGTNTARTLTLTGTNTGANTLAGTIGNNGTGATSLSKTGPGTWVLTNTNGYLGSTSITEGTLELSGSGSINSSALTLNGGTFKNNSTAAYDSTAGLNFVAGTLAGTNWNGDLGGQTIGTGKSISPGNSPGTANTTSQTWAAGGSYVWEINDATGNAGGDPGWDLLSGTGGLAITATDGAEFVINITSLALTNIAGNAINFDPSQSYAWKIADFGTDIIGFDAAAFALNTAGFSNATTQSFGIALGSSVAGGDNSQLYVTYAVPEPTVLSLAGAVGLGLLGRRRRRSA